MVKFQPLIDKIVTENCIFQENAKFNMSAKIIKKKLMCMKITK